MILPRAVARRNVFRLMLPLIVLLLWHAGATTPLDYKTFPLGQAVWIATPEGISLFRSESRMIRNITLSENMPNDSIVDITENGGELYVIAKSGVYLIDGTSTTIERLPGEERSYKDGKITADFDYIWINAEDTLWRFDKLGREWFAYPATTTGQQLCGIFSDETSIINVYTSTVDVFTIADEKWASFPNKEGFSIPGDVRFFTDKNALLFVGTEVVYRYTVDAQTWDVIDAKAPLIDLFFGDTVLVYQTEKGLFQYMTQSSVTRPLDVPNVTEILCFTRIDDTLFCATENSIVKYDIIAQIADNIDQPPGITDPHMKKFISFGSLLLGLYPGQLAMYDTRKKIWDLFKHGSSKEGFKRVIWDDDNGLRGNYSGSSYSQLRGSYQQEMKMDSLSGYNPTFFMPRINLTLHNQVTSDRYADIFFDNSDKSIVPEKGVFYRGAEKDYLETFRVGTNTVETPQSKTIMPAQFEGLGGVLQSKTSLKTRDRRIVKIQSGAGKLTTKTIYEVLPYEESGIYRLQLAGVPGAAKKTVVPGSVKISIDGEDIDTTYYTFSLPTKMLTFNRLDLLDPSSIIKVSYQIRLLPDAGIEAVEFIPQYDFGTLGYAAVSVSPVDWLSPQVSYYYLRSDRLHQMMSVALPTELRVQSKGFLLKMNPELTYDTETRKKALALAFQSRVFDKLSVGYNVLVPDSGYVSTDNIDKGYGRLKLDTDTKVQYDILPQLPVRYLFQNTRSVDGEEVRHEFSTGTRFQGLPFSDISISRNRIAARMRDTVSVLPLFNDSLDSAYSVASFAAADSIIVDSIDRGKDKLKVRVFEKQSPYIEKLLHINKLSYDLSYTGFLASREDRDKPGYGSIIYGTGTLSPVKSIALTARSLYLKNPEGADFGSMYTPALILQTIDAPPGFDITARNEITYKSIIAQNNGILTNRRNLSLTLKPGKWWQYLGWLQPIMSYSQNTGCLLDGLDPDPWSIIRADEGIRSKTTTRSVGANIFPVSEISLRHDNQWIAADSLNRYYTYNDLKWWFTSKKYLQLRWEFDHDTPVNKSADRQRNYHRGFGRYTAQWTPWFQSVTGVTGSWLTSDTLRQVKVGPDVNLTVNLLKFAFVRSLLNSHNLNIAWNRKNGVFSSAPDIMYSMYFKVVVLPNISLISNTSLIFRENEFSTFNGSFTGMVLF